jgi:hypothetical protein
LCTTNRVRRNLVLKVLLAHGANPNCATKNSAETGGFMRDCRTKGETLCNSYWMPAPRSMPRT